MDFLWNFSNLIGANGTLLWRYYSFDCCFISVVSFTNEWKSSLFNEGWVYLFQFIYFMKMNCFLTRGIQFEMSLCTLLLFWREDDCDCDHFVTFSLQNIRDFTVLKQVSIYFASFDYIARFIVIYICYVLKQNIKYGRIWISSLIFWSKCVLKLYIHNCSS